MYCASSRFWRRSGEYHFSLELVADEEISPAGMGVLNGGGVRLYSPAAANRSGGIAESCGGVVWNEACLSYPVSQRPGGQAEFSPHDVKVTEAHRDSKNSDMAREG